MPTGYKPVPTQTGVIPGELECRSVRISILTFIKHDLRVLFSFLAIISISY
jgi:hypothetical protein